MSEADDQLMAAYRATFQGPHGQRVLTDLAAYCHARRSEFDPNERMHAFRSGQRDVFMRITEFTTLSVEEIYRLRGFALPPSPEKEETDG